MDEDRKGYIDSKGILFKYCVIYKVWWRKTAKKVQSFFWYIGFWWLINWFIRHQKLSSYITAASALVSLHFSEKENKALRFERNEAVKAEIFIRTKVDEQGTRLDNIDLPVFKVVKVGDRYKVIDLNKSYTDDIGLRRRDAIGFSAYELAPLEVAEAINGVNQRIVAYWKEFDTIEKFPIRDGSIAEFYSHKNPALERGDTVIYGYSIPLLKLVKVVDDHPIYEVIEIVSDTVPDAVSDTILRK